MSSARNYYGDDELSHEENHRRAAVSPPSSFRAVALSFIISLFRASARIRRTRRRIQRHADPTTMLVVFLLATNMTWITLIKTMAFIAVAYVLEWMLYPRIIRRRSRNSEASAISPISGGMSWTAMIQLTVILVFVYWIKSVFF